MAMHHTPPAAETTASAAPSLHGHRVAVDPEGDVVLAVTYTGPEGTGQARSFLASSKLLTLASPVFAKMFAPCFSEGAALRSNSATSSPTTVRLEEDDPDAMEMLLRALHFDTDTVPETAPFPDMLAKLAMLSNKYDCNRAMKPWIALWITCNVVDNMQDLSDQQALGKLVLAAYLFRSSRFEDACADVAVQLATNFASIWAQEPMLQTCIPESVLGGLSDEVERLRAELRNEMERVEWKLRQTASTYTMWRKVCLRCNRAHPETAKKCHPCNNTDLLEKCCTYELRIAEYFAALRMCGLWPSSAHGSLSAGHLAAKMVEIPDSFSDHKCKGAALCPLKKETARLKERALEILEAARGVSLV